VIEEILPAAAASVETRDNETAGGPPAEAELVEGATEKRRAEFATGRACARAALRTLGFPPAPILAGERGEPLWPVGVVGSITHCDGYRAAAVARAAELASLGIDAESHLPLREGLLPRIARPEERPVLDELAEAAPGAHWDRLLFSAKESVYKAWFPLARSWLGFEDMTLLIDPAGAFTVQVLVDEPAMGGGEGSDFEGRWLIRDGLILTAVAVRRAASRD